MISMSQLLLPLTSKPTYDANNLVVHPGIEQPLRGVQTVYGAGAPPLPFTFLHGDHGTGKTHVLRVVATILKQRPDLEAQRVKLISVRGGANVCEELNVLVDEEASQDGPFALLVDDVHLLGPGDVGKLWNIANKLERAGLPLVTASLFPPEAVFADNPHLRSRLVSGLVFGLEAPDDSIRVLILDKMARDRNVRLTHDVANYLVTRKARNIKELEIILELLDLESLRLKRRITLPLVRSLESTGLF